MSIAIVGGRPTPAANAAAGTAAASTAMAPSRTNVRRVTACASRRCESLPGRPRSEHEGQDRAGRQEPEQEGQRLAALRRQGALRLEPGLDTRRRALAARVDREVEAQR